jgi:uncharacterized cupredoxin-like copper-binding protein
MTNRYRVVALAAAALLLFGACGDDDGGGDGNGDGNTLSVEADSFQFSPSSWTVPGNTDIEITLTNASNVDEHEWAVLVEGVTISSEAEFSEDIVLTEIEAVPPGGSDTVTLSFAPGTYQVICALEGHLDSGMTGTLTVTP